MRVKVEQKIDIRFLVGNFCYESRVEIFGVENLANESVRYLNKIIAAGWHMKQTL